MSTLAAIGFISRKDHSPALFAFSTASRRRRTDYTRLTCICYYPHGKRFSRNGLFHGIHATLFNTSTTTLFNIVETILFSSSAKNTIDIVWRLSQNCLRTFSFPLVYTPKRTKIAEVLFYSAFIWYKSKCKVFRQTEPGEKTWATTAFRYSNNNLEYVLCSFSLCCIAFLLGWISISTAFSSRWHRVCYLHFICSRAEQSRTLSNVHSNVCLRPIWLLLMPKQHCGDDRGREWKQCENDASLMQKSWQVDLAIG